MIHEDIVASLSTFLQSQDAGMKSRLEVITEAYEQVMQDEPYRSALLTDGLIRRYQYMRSMRYSIGVLKHLPARRITSTTDEKREEYENDIRKALAGIMETLLRERLLTAGSSFDHRALFTQYRDLAEECGCLDEKTGKAYDKAMTLLEQLP